MKHAYFATLLSNQHTLLLGLFKFNNYSSIQVDSDDEAATDSEDEAPKKKKAPAKKPAAKKQKAKVSSSLLQ
jgi:hypothetical protein